jgi:archaellum component FlaG (FlaF/FlaG flagellin family)
MSVKMILFIVAILLIAALLAGGLRRGPRVTQIDRTVRREKDSGDA